MTSSNQRAPGLSKLRLALAGPILIHGPALAQTGSDVSETIVVVGTRPDTDTKAFETRHEVDEAAVAELRATSLDEIIARLPSAHVPTNSRGESMTCFTSPLMR